MRNCLNDDVQSCSCPLWRSVSRMAQAQSTWFPLSDRNPQTFVPSIYTTKAEDCVKPATQRIYTSQERPSRVVLPVVR